MAPCDFYLFGKLHLAMKGKRFSSVEAIQKDCTDILKDIPVNDLKHSFEKLLDRAKQCSILAQSRLFWNAPSIIFSYSLP